MADSYKVANHQEVNFLNLSLSRSFGAQKNNPSNLSQDEIDKNWHAIDLSRYDAVGGPFTEVGGFLKFKEYNNYSHDNRHQENRDVAFVGALEYLSDVRPFTRTVRNLLIQGRSVELFVGYGGGYYCWSSDTAQAFLSSMGISVTSVLRVSVEITKLTLGCSQLDYENFLQRAHLPAPGFSHLIVTTEHSGYRVTGGIGSYVKECDSLYGDDVAILILDNNVSLDLQKIETNKWMTPQIFLGFDRVDEIMASNFDTYGDVVEETLECILALYPNIETIESQEMLLNRAIDAKALSILPPEVKLITTCHGSSFHLAKAKRTVLDAENIHVAYREKYTLEYSDIVILPTNYLRDSYIDSGIKNLDDKSRIKKRLPFDLERLPKGDEVQRYERLLYIGKTSTIKGFDLFLESLLEIYRRKPVILEQIKEVVIMATSIDITEPYLKKLFNQVVAIYNVKIVSLDREILLKTLAEYSADTLALITYRGDNHPLAVLELMAIGHDFIAANAAGTPELILPGFEEHNLAPANTSGYANAVSEAILNPRKRSPVVTDLRQQYFTEQKKINESYTVKALRELPTVIQNGSDDMNSSKANTVRVSIVGDKDSILYKSTLVSVRAQTYKHIELESENVEKTGLRMRLYEGDVLHPDAIELMVAMHVKYITDSVGAVMTDEVVMAYDGDGSERGFEEFHPYAPELGSVFFQEKYSRRVIALFDGEYLDDSFTDWQKVIAASCGGKRIAIVPQLLSRLANVEGYFTDDTIALSSRYAHSFTALPVFDATVLYSELERFDQIYWGLRPIGHLHQYFADADEFLRRANISPKVVRVVGAYHRFTPALLKRAVSASGNLTFDALRKIKNKLKK